MPTTRLHATLNRPELVVSSILALYQLEVWELGSPVDWASLLSSPTKPCWSDQNVWPPIYIKSLTQKCVLNYKKAQPWLHFSGTNFKCHRCSQIRVTLNPLTCPRK